MARPLKRRARLSVVTALALATMTLSSLIGSPIGSAGAATANYPAPAGGNGGSTATGVTSSAINLALIYSITGPAPGVTAGALRGAKSYVAYINSLGGIYGRKLNLTAYDDGFDPTKAQAACAQIIPSDFAIAGGFSIGDAGCYQSVKSSGIPWSQFFYDNQMESLPNVYFAGVGSIYKEPTGEEEAMHHLFPKVTKVASLYEQQSPGNSQEQAHINVAVKKAGFDVVLSEPISDLAPSYSNYVVQLKNSGAQAIFMDAASTFSQSRLAMAMAQQNYHPVFVTGNTSYAQNWHKIAGPGAANWVANLNYLPYLDSKAMNSQPGGAEFQKWFNKTNPGQSIDLFAMYGWTSMALLGQGMINAGPKLTRTSVLAAIHKIHDWTAQGLLAPSDVGNKQYSNCYAIQQATSSGYKQLLPAKLGEFDCKIGGATIINTPGVPS
jgi:ABC-type branched-subunit amino acid transport system substrate-binding protein